MRHVIISYTISKYTREIPFPPPPIKKKKKKPSISNQCVVYCVRVQGRGADTRGAHAQRVGGRVAVPPGGAAHGQTVRGRRRVLRRVRGRRAGQRR